MYNLVNRGDPYQRIKNRIIAIYIIKCDKHCYIGSSMDFVNRIINHRFLLLNNRHKNKFFQNCYNKYKTLEFGILQQFDYIENNTELFKIESSWIKLLKSDMNLSDLEHTGGNHQSRIVYQYDIKSGNLIKEWNSVTDASISLNLNKHGIFNCTSDKFKACKSAYGFVWSYNKLNNIKYVNTVGINLPKTKVELFEDNISIGVFNSIGLCAKFLYLHISYTKDWKNLRTYLHRSLKSNKIIESKYLVKYKI